MAEAVANKFGLSVDLFESLREKNLGILEGQPGREETRLQLASGLSVQQFAPPGGENFIMVRDRVVPVVRGLIALHPGETILFCSHGGTNIALIAELLGRPFDEIYRAGQRNTCVNILEVGGDGNVVPVVLNCALHLEALLRPV